MYLIVSTPTILVHNFKNSLWFTRHERLYEVIRNVSPWGEQNLVESTLNLKLRSIFIYISCHPFPEVLNRVQVWWTRVDDPENSFDLQAVWIAASSLLHRASSVKRDDRSNMPMYPVAFWRSSTTCNSIVPLYENAPIPCWVSSIVSPWGSLRSLLFKIPCLMISRKFQSRSFVPLKKTGSLKTFEFLKLFVIKCRQIVFERHWAQVGLSESIYRTHVKFS